MANGIANGPSGQTTDSEARAALEEIERSRRHVIDEIEMPRWYWWGLAGAWIALGTVTDLRHPWLTAAATLVFGAVHSAVAQRVEGGRHRTSQLSVRADVVGRHVQVWLFVGLIGLAGVTIAGAWIASDAGVGHPVTIVSIFVAVLIVLGGPRMMAVVRRGAGRSHESR